MAMHPSTQVKLSEVRNIVPTTTSHSFSYSLFLLTSNLQMSVYKTPSLPPPHTHPPTLFGNFLNLKNLKSIRMALKEWPLIPPLLPSPFPPSPTFPLSTMYLPSEMQPIAITLYHRMGYNCGNLLIAICELFLHVCSHNVRDS